MDGPVNLAQKNLALNLWKDERLAMVDKANREVPLKVQAELLSLSCSSLFYCWSLEELFAFPLPILHWSPPVQPGRLSKETL